MSDGAKGLGATDYIFDLLEKIHARCGWHILEKNLKTAKIPHTRQHKQRAWSILKVGWLSINVNLL